MSASALDESIVVVGGSLAGVRSAQALRREGHTGPLTVIGEEPHWPPYDRPPLSKQVLLGTIEAERARLRVPDDLAITALPGRRATGLDLSARSVGVDDGTEVAFDRLVVATGAHPRTIPGTERLGGVHVVRTVDDSLALKADLATARSVAVVGAGFIGCEVASACLSLGLEVTVVDVLPLPLAPLGSSIGEYVAGLMRSGGVRLHFGTAVSALTGTDRVEAVELADGTRVEADVVVVGIGVIPSTAWLAGSGLTVDNGVVCDSYCLAEGGGGRVAAAGDVARWAHPRSGLVRIEHWTNATEQAAHAARALLHGHAAGEFAPVPYFWSDQFGAKLQLVGVCRPDQPVEVIEGSMEEGRFVVAYTEGRRIEAVLCVSMPRRLAEWQARLSSGETVEL